MGEVKHKISANYRSVQDKKTQEICKKRLGLYHKGHIRLDYLARVIERRFTKIRRYSDYM